MLNSIKIKNMLNSIKIENKQYSIRTLSTEEKDQSLDMYPGKSWK